nr:ABC transporter ATP-binding protein [Maliibacterium massiliense]
MSLLMHEAPLAQQEPVIAMRDVCKNYSGDVQALYHINLAVYEGDFVAIMGPSGSGKSTLLNILGCLDTPSSGAYYIGGEDVRAFSRDALARVRAKTIGFVFQSFNLLPRLTSQENVELPLYYQGLPREARHARARAALAQMRLEQRASHVPGELSGGQRQRVAIARALVNRPSLLLADEPTGNLDSRTGAEIMQVLSQLNARGVTIVLITHEREIAQYARTHYTMRDGRLHSGLYEGRG